jgi:preprotein translocase subunit SecB
VDQKDRGQSQELRLKHEIRRGAAWPPFFLLPTVENNIAMAHLCAKQKLNHRRNEPVTKEDQNQPVFSIVKIYNRDISFENPNAPQSFSTAENSPKIELNLGVQNRQVNEDHWEVSLKVSVLAKDSESNDMIFEVEVEQAGLFLLQHIPEEHLPAVLGVDCPAIIFPYARQIISQLTVDGGFIPLLLDPFNFGAAYQSSQEQQETTH